MMMYTFTAHGSKSWMLSSPSSPTLPQPPTFLVGPRPPPVPLRRKQLGVKQVVVVVLVVVVVVVVVVAVVEDNLCVASFYGLHKLTALYILRHFQR